MSEKTIYKCENCESCSYKKECIKGNNCKTPLEERTKNTSGCENIPEIQAGRSGTDPSEEGILFRTNRSIQAEGSFGESETGYAIQKILKQRESKCSGKKVHYWQWQEI